MTYESILTEYRGVDYSKVPATESHETPVLDLSCKKTPPSSPGYDYSKEISPLRGSTYTEQHQEETNNNDSKQISSYQTEIEKNKENQINLYRSDDRSNFSTSNHERTSPFENRAYIMTPPSDSGSPKRTKYQAIYDHTNVQLSESIARAYPSYPILPIPLTVSMPLKVPAIFPQMIQQSGPAILSDHQSRSGDSPSSHDYQSEEVKKAPRPFKAYPKDPLSITLGPDMIFDQEMKQAYSDFRNKMLDSVKRTNEGTNVKMRRVSKSPILTSSTCDDKDAAYWERRRKNNEAAKRSRDARRAKEDEIAIRAAFLEQEYLRLKYENSILREENKKLTTLVYCGKVPISA